MTNRDVKKEVDKYKHKLLEYQLESLEDDFKKNNSHNLFKAVRNCPVRKQNN